MAEGILALFGKGKRLSSPEEDDDESSPSSVKARAVRDLFRLAKQEDWDGAAEAFHRAYVACKEKLEADGVESEEGGEESGEYDDEE